MPQSTRFVSGKSVLAVKSERRNSSGDRLRIRLALHFASGLAVSPVHVSTCGDQPELRLRGGRTRASRQRASSAKDPVAADVVLVPAADAEDLAFVGNERPAELRNEEVVEQNDLLARHFVDVVEVDVLGAPLEVVHVLPRRVGLLENEGVTKQEEFQWQTQLKAVYDTQQNDFLFAIADARLNYGYEYLGNGPRLVITPLTDRIYVTAT